MKKETETPLFQLQENERFDQKINGLTELHLDGVFPIDVLGRGFTTYLNNGLRQVSFLQHSIIAQMQGQSTYTTTLSVRDSEIYGDCTCPFEGRCKHQAALLIYIIRDTDQLKLD